MQIISQVGGDFLQSLDIFWIWAKITSISFLLNLFGSFFFPCKFENLYVSLRTKSRQTFPRTTLYLLCFRSFFALICVTWLTVTAHVRRISLSSSVNTPPKKKKPAVKVIVPAANRHNKISLWNQNDHVCKNVLCKQMKCESEAGIFL